MNSDSIILGTRENWGGPGLFGLSPSDHRYHVYVIGKTGSGKTTLLRNMIVQHLAAGHGVGLIDPHGDLAEELLHHIPPWRADHLCYFNPGDLDFPVGLNLLANVAPDDRHLVASGIVGAFKSIWGDSWGPRLEYILYNAIAALLDCENTTLLGVNRLLTDDTYRAWVVRQIKDPFIREFWAEEFANYDVRFRREAIAPIQNKLGQFLLNPVVRNILGQVRSKVSFRFIMDNERIFIANLSKGKLGHDKANLLGSPAAQAPDTDQSRFSPPTTSPWISAGRSANQTHWRSVTVRTNTATGRVVLRTNSFVEIGGEINVLVGTNFVSADPSFAVSPEGAEALGAAHKVSVPADVWLGDGIKITQRDGQQLVFQPLGIDYYDPTDGHSVLLDAVTNAVGWLVASNEIVFSNCLTHIKASLRIRNFTWGLESDLILHERPPDPQEFGLSSAARLEMLTEQIGGASPTIRPRFIRQERDMVKLSTMVDPHFLDAELSFGSMKMGLGKAFATNPRTNRVVYPPNPVGKSFETIQQRRIIIEAVEHRNAAPSLNQLPAATEAGITNAALNKSENRNVAALTRQLPAVSGVFAVRAERVARTASIRKAPGAPTSSSDPNLLTSASTSAFVLDYQLVTVAGETDLTFHGGTNYLVTSLIPLHGTTTIQGGAIIKFNDNTGLYLQSGSTIVCDTTNWLPAVFTSVDDNSIGEVLGSGTPWQIVAPALNFDGGTHELRNLRFKHIGNPVQTENITTITARNVQFVDTYAPFTFYGSGSLYVFNALAKDFYYFYDGGVETFVGEHITAHDGAFAFGIAGNSILKNSLLVNTPAPDGGTHVEPNTVQSSDSSLFTSSDTGDHYLASSVHRDQGTALIDPELKASLAEMTTFPPEPLTGTRLNPLELVPLPIRDTEDPDIGYHYPAVDYLIKDLSLQNTTLSLANGVVVAGSSASEWGLPLWLNPGKLVSVGMPTRMNRLIRASQISETGRPRTMSIVSSGAADQFQPEVVLRFTDISSLAGETDHFYITTFSHFEASHSAFFNGGLRATLYDGSYQTVALTNNLFRSVVFEFVGLYPGYLYVFNNLFKDGSFMLYNANEISKVYDNVFDKVFRYAYSPSISSSHNVYIGDDELEHQTPLPTDVLSYSFYPLPYENGPLGRFYSPVEFRNEGSRNADTAGLYHFTTTTDHAKEKSTPVDIGLHYVALGSENEVADFDGDGIPDYVEDTNGNGLSENSESDFVRGDTDQDGLSDGAELSAGSNPRSTDSDNDGVDDDQQDTDGDGLPDWYEVAVSQTNPLNVDTGNAGILDCDRDSDGDGVTNLGEYENATDPLVFDAVAAEADAPSEPFPHLFRPTHIGRGSAGALQLLVSSIPRGAVALRIYRHVETTSYPNANGVPQDYTPTTDGTMDVSVGDLISGRYTVPNAFVPAFGRYVLTSRWIDNQNNQGPLGAPIILRNMPFLDGTSALKDNLRFIFRAERGGPPLRFICDAGICHQDYAESGLFDGTLAALKELQPFSDNYYYRNWMYAAADMTGVPGTARLFATKVNGDGTDPGTPLKYNFPAREYVDTRQSSLLNSQLGGSDFTYLRFGVPIQFQDPEAFEQTYHFSNAGLVFLDEYNGNGGIHTELQSGFPNLFGLPYASVAAVNANSFVEIVAGAPPIFNESPFIGREYFQNVTAPQFTTVGFYFGDDNDILPGQTAFALNTPSPVLVAAVGEAIQVFGWAKQQIDNGANGKFGYLGQYFDKAFVADANNNATTIETGLLSEYGEFFPTQPGLAILKTKSDGGVNGEAKVHVIGLATDVNRDGTINSDFQNPDFTTSKRPFRFWINDDHDAGETKGNDIPSSSNPFGFLRLPNALSGGVEGVRDLIDFFPVAIDLGTLITALPMDGTVKYKLKHADAALNCVFTGLTRQNPLAYQTDSSVGAIFGPDLDEPPGKAPTAQISAAGIEIPGAVLNSFQQHSGQGVLLIEGRRSTTQPLVLEISKNGQVLGRAELHLNLNTVEKMFRHKNLVRELLPGNTQGADDRLTESGVPNEPESNGKNFVFLHGYNVNPNSARGWLSETFKRMYWSGSQARFYGITWWGSKGQMGSVTPNYHQNVVTALASAEHLKVFLDGLTGENVLAAHSLGNMVVLGALNDWNAPIAKYFMLNAAVALEAVSDDVVPLSAVDDNSAINEVMIHPLWTAYPARLRASEWYRFFEDMPGDGRSKLTWRRRLSNFRSAQVYNFYSTGDELFRSPPVEVPSMPEVTLEQAGTILGSFVRQRLGGPGGVPLAVHSWAYQEKLKGRTLFNWFLGSNHGGWGTNPNPPPADSPPETLRANPFFDRTFDTELYGVNGSQYAHDNRDRILSDAIPSSTLPVGGNRVPRLGIEGILNFDMHLTFKDGWPEVRTADESRWHHSDIREVAYKFVHPLFEQIVLQGNLNQP